MNWWKKSEINQHVRTHAATTAHVYGAFSALPVLVESEVLQIGFSC